MTFIAVLSEKFRRSQKKFTQNTKNEYDNVMIHQDLTVIELNTDGPPALYYHGIGQLV